jgi:hypothetical protein
MQDTVTTGSPEGLMELVESGDGVFCDGEAELQATCLVQRRGAAGALLNRDRHGVRRGVNRRTPT